MRGQTETAVEASVEPSTLNARFVTVATHFASKLTTQHARWFDVEVSGKDEFPRDVPNVGEDALEELELSVALANQLSKAGLETVQHLCERTEAELLEMKGFGCTHLKEAKEVLASLGLSLGMRF